MSVLKADTLDMSLDVRHHAVNLTPLLLAIETLVGWLNWLKSHASYVSLAGTCRPRMAVVGVGEQTRMIWSPIGVDWRKNCVWGFGG